MKHKTTRKSLKELLLRMALKEALKPRKPATRKRTR